MVGLKSGTGIPPTPSFVEPWKPRPPRSYLCPLMSSFSPEELTSWLPSTHLWFQLLRICFPPFLEQARHLHGGGRSREAACHGQVPKGSVECGWGRFGDSGV